MKTEGHVSSCRRPAWQSQWAGVQLLVLHRSSRACRSISAVHLDPRIRDGLFFRPAVGGICQSQICLGHGNFCPSPTPVTSPNLECRWPFGVAKTDLSSIWALSMTVYLLGDTGSGSVERHRPCLPSRLHCHHRDCANWTPYLVSSGRRNPVYLPCLVCRLPAGAVERAVVIFFFQAE